MGIGRSEKPTRANSLQASQKAASGRGQKQTLVGGGFALSVHLDTARESDDIKASPAGFDSGPNTYFGLSAKAFPLHSNNPACLRRSSMSETCEDFAGEVASIKVCLGTTQGPGG